MIVNDIFGNWFVGFNIGGVILNRVVFFKILVIMIVNIFFGDFFVGEIIIGNFVIILIVEVIIWDSGINILIFWYIFIEFIFFIEIIIGGDSNVIVIVNIIIYFGDVISGGIVVDDVFVNMIFIYIVINRKVCVNYYNYVMNDIDNNVEIIGVEFEVFFIYLIFLFLDIDIII